MGRVAFLLAAVVLVAPGCRSAERQGRDYLSVNRSSIRYLKETFRSNRAVSRDSLKRTMDFKPRIEVARRQARMGRRYAGDSIFEGQWEEFRASLRGVRRELTWPKDFKERYRFGHIDNDLPGQEGR